jgi:hypothetical protein
MKLTFNILMSSVSEQDENRKMYIRYLVQFPNSNVHFYREKTYSYDETKVYPMDYLTSDIELQLSLCQEACPMIQAEKNVKTIEVELSVPVEESVEEFVEESVEEFVE